MRISEVKTLISYDISRFICLDDEKFVQLINGVSLNKFKFKSEVEKEVEIIYKKMELKLLKIDCYQLANLYLTHDDRIEIYKSFCNYFFFIYSNDKSPLALKRLEDRLKLDKIETLHYREDYFRKIYMQENDFTGVIKGMLSYFWISFANDGQIDKAEWDYFKSLCRKLNLGQKVSIQKFDLATLLKFTSVNVKKLQKIKEVILGAAQSDGVIKASEIGLIKKIVNLLDVSNIDLDLSENTELLMTLSVILSDEKLADGEKNWFLKMYKARGKALNMNEAFVFLDIVMSKDHLYHENLEFFNQIWGRKSSNFELVLRLYIAYSKYYLKVNEEKLKSLISLLDRNNLESINFNKKINTGEVTKEELMILYGILTSDFYSLKKFNLYLDHNYFERVFLSIRSSGNKIEYFFTVCSLLIDDKITGKEYEIVWKKCAKLNLDFEQLESTIKDYSLLNQRQFNVNTYFTYLRQESS